jgi:hypothetical protein
LYIIKSAIDVDTLQYDNLQHSEEKSLNILRESGFIGCGTGDSNLSTNYKTRLAQEWSDADSSW